MKIWNTKYALTAKVFFQEAEEKGDGSVRTTAGGPLMYLHGYGREWHDTRESAIRRCEEMRARKIASLHKQIARLKALDFEREVPQGEVS